jgi:hypothetical protein
LLNGYYKFFYDKLGHAAFVQLMEHIDMKELDGKMSDEEVEYYLDKYKDVAELRQTIYISSDDCESFVVDSSFVDKHPNMSFPNNFTKSSLVCRKRKNRRKKSWVSTDKKEGGKDEEGKNEGKDKEGEGEEGKGEDKEGEGKGEEGKDKGEEGKGKGEEGKGKGEEGKSKGEEGNGEGEEGNGEGEDGEGDEGDDALMVDVDKGNKQVDVKQEPIGSNADSVFAANMGTHDANMDVDRDELASDDETMGNVL